MSRDLIEIKKKTIADTVFKPGNTAFAIVPSNLPKVLDMNTNSLSISFYETVQWVISFSEDQCCTGCRISIWCCRFTGPPSTLASSLKHPSLLLLLLPPFSLPPPWPPPSCIPHSFSYSSLPLGVGVKMAYPQNQVNTIFSGAIIHE